MYMRSASASVHAQISMGWRSLEANSALNLAPFGRWTLRDKAAQRRLALR